jgi:putative nucleotidyltransferase with HDIG domain
MRIVFIDDDKNVLEGLNRMLSPLLAVLQMEFYDSAVEGLAKVKDSPCDLVVCDLQMPGLNGIQVLEQIRASSPGTIRFILTGMIDHPLHHAALRLAHQVISKPCRPELFRELIQRSLRLKHRLDQSELAAVLPRLQALPSLPGVYQQVIDHLSSPTASCRGLSRLISEDVGMSARIMQLANSAYYGRPGKVHNLLQAIVYLGMKTVEAMVLKEGIFSTIDPALAERFSMAELENHCLRVGMLSKRIATDLGLPAEMLEQSSMAGILHDTGKIIMIAEFTDSYQKAIVQSRRQKTDLSSAEKQISGFTHAELGATLLNLWSMPADIIETTAFHHSPWLLAGPEDTAGRSLSLADVVYLADCIDHQFCSGWCDGCTCSVNESYLEEYGLTDQYRLWQADHLAAQHQEVSYAQKR